MNKTFFYIAKKKARISITIEIPTAPLRLRNLELLVFEESMDEGLPSLTLLHSLGFNLNHHLEMVRDTFHGTDFSHIRFNRTDNDNAALAQPSRIAKLLLNRAHPHIDAYMGDDGPHGILKLCRISRTS